ncbi:UNVERIFIED_CONTAM: hypothetical protein FKN15_068395 [Acipenser sinensis]
MTELLSSSSNYSWYRRVYADCSGFKIPILGVHLKDLVSLNEALPDYLEDNKINLSKLQHVYSNVNELLQLSLDLYYTEDEIYELSYAKEPRNPKIQPATPAKPPVMADWASGVAPRHDPVTISKHVKQMVDSVMKNYDPNQDGYISQEDFEKIAASFPFSYCPQDREREGLISHDEITSYFMRGISICAKLGLNFVHNFQETTYKKPTFCDTCNGFIRHQRVSPTFKREKETEGERVTSVKNQPSAGFLCQRGEDVTTKIREKPQPVYQKYPLCSDSDADIAIQRKGAPSSPGQA